MSPNPLARWLNQVFQQPALIATVGVLGAVENAGEGIVTGASSGEGLVVDLQVGRIVDEFTGGLVLGSKSPLPKPTSLPIASTK